MAGSMDGKTVLVTGGGSGIGRATALAFATAGATVVVADVRRGGRGDETIRSMDGSSGTGSFIRADVSIGSDVEKLIAEIVDRHGRLDCAFNNAGIQGDLSPTAECSEENLGTGSRASI